MVRGTEEWVPGIGVPAAESAAMVKYTTEHKILVGVACLAILGVILVFVLPIVRGHPGLDAWDFMRSVARAEVDANRDGEWWVGDISELAEWGRLPLEMAKADISPLHPLTPKPIPYRGFYVVATRSIVPTVSIYDHKPVSLNGVKRSKLNFGYCVFPAEDGRQDLPTYLVNDLGIYRKYGLGNRPILDWPGDMSTTGWAIVD